MHCMLCAIPRYEQLQYDEQQLAYEVQLQQQLQQLQRGNYEGDLQTYGGPTASEAGMSSVEIAQAARLEREINGELRLAVQGAAFFLDNFSGIRDTLVMGQLTKAISVTQNLCWPL